MKEIWDIVDANGMRTGRTIAKGEKMAPGDHHPAVSVWIRNAKGEYLISRRSQNARAAGGMWETTSGSVIAGEESLQAALRETKEELGLCLDSSRARLFCSYTWPQRDGNGAVFYDVWLFPCDAPIDSLHLREGETADAVWAAPDTIRRLIAEGAFIPYTYLEDLFALCL